MYPMFQVIGSAEAPVLNPHMTSYSQHESRWLVGVRYLCARGKSVSVCFH